MCLDKTYLTDGKKRKTITVFFCIMKNNLVGGFQCNTLICLKSISLLRFSRLGIVLLYTQWALFTKL